MMDVMLDSWMLGCCVVEWGVEMLKDVMCWGVAGCDVKLCFCVGGHCGVKV